MNKRGFELVWSNVVVMVLAVMILIFSIMFFTGAGKSFLDSVKVYFSGSNVDTVVQSCNLVADSNSQYKYCCEKIKVKYLLNGKSFEAIFSCHELLNQSFSKDKIKVLNCEDAGC